MPEVVRPAKFASALEEHGAGRAVAGPKCPIMPIERKSSIHTGTDVTDKAQSLAEQRRPA